MPTFHLKPEDLPQVLRDQGKEFPQAVRRGARAGAMRGQAHMPKKTPTDMGQLRNSWRVGEAGGTRLVNDAPHAGVVEAGARPHPVSAEGREAIYRWVLRNLRDGIGWQVRIDRANDIAAGKGRGTALKTRTEKMAWSITYAICQRIAREGQAPTYFTRAEMPTLTRFAQQEINREIRRLLNLPPKGAK